MHSTLKINPYESLSTTELTVMGNLEKLISKNTPDKTEKILNAFKNYALTTQARLLHYSNPIRDFCETNTRVRDIIAAKLKEFNSPNIEIVSKNKDESHNILDHVFSYHLMDTFINKRRDDVSGMTRVNILNEACALGSYHGLIIRCKFNLVALNSASMESYPEKTSALIQKILLDCDHLTNLYGAIGYIRKGIVLLELNRFYQTKNEIDRVSDTKEQAIKNFLCASLLQTDEYSNALIDSITKGEGLPSLLADFADTEFKISSWMAAKILFQDSVGKDIFTLLENQANTEIQSDVARSQRLIEKRKLGVKRNSL